MALLAAAAGGCGGKQTMLSGSPPPTLRREAFSYQAPADEPRAVAPRPAAPAPAPLPPLELPRLAPAIPPHDSAWEVSAVSRPWRFIVIHHSATAKGCAAAFDAYHRNGRKWDELGYHFVIGNGTGSGDGQVEVGSRWPKQKHGAHCKVGNDETYNQVGIGICLVGDFERGGRPSASQMDALARLIDYLAARYRIADDHVIGHGDVDDTRCPGRQFSMAELFAGLRRLRAARQSLARAP
jgi:hypothetical protein